MRAADYVFETLSRAILTGELVPGSVLATQRELSQQFGVSPLVVRQATHRLEELGLVRVRQGSTTIVLDPDQATDFRLIELQLELAIPGDRLGLAALEMQVLTSFSLLALAERRITEDELQALDELVDALPETITPLEAIGFRVQFWGRIAQATRNPVVARQIRWWARVLQDLEKRTRTAREGGVWTDGPGTPQRAVYRNLVKALRKRRGSVEVWSRVVSHMLEWSESRPQHAMHDAQKGGNSSTNRSRSAR